MTMLKDYTQNREAILALLPRMFEIIAQNMREIAPTGNTLEEDRKSWTQAMLAELNKPEKRWVMAFDRNEQLVGYVLYRIHGATLHMDEIQVAKTRQGDGKIFPGLLGKLLRDGVDADVITLCSHANKHNEKSQGILQALGLRPVKELPRGLCYEGGFDDAFAWFRGKYSCKKE